MPIDTLISESKSFELVRDQIVSILATETAAQQALATAASEDPDDYALRIFSERSNPYGEWTDSLDDDIDATPIVNVRFETVNFDGNRGNVVTRQTGEATYHIDCYGLGVAAETEDGYTPADEMASKEASRAAGLVQSILMAGIYTYLGYPRGGDGQLVFKRWIQSITSYEPRQDERGTHVIGAVRIVLSVTINETHPQVQGEALDRVNVQLQRASDGSVYADLAFSESE